MKTIDKIVYSQDAFFKTEPKRSGETSINLSNEIFEFLGGLEDDYITFSIYKEDYIKALSTLIVLLPLYKSSSTSFSRVEYSDDLYENYYQIIQKKFGSDESANYKVHLFLRSDGRIYLNELKEKETGFNIRQFFIQGHTKLSFIKRDDDTYEIRMGVSFKEFDKNQTINSETKPSNFSSDWKQKMYFGTPGSGKSFLIRQLYEMKLEGGEYIEDEEKKKRVIRTTFHPDTDYATFVGCYKPITYEKDGEKKISYEFVPQAFTDAYVKAWSDPQNQYTLIIEEINRGNCAQIFGDLFQLLDRNKEGFSDYPINADNDLRDYLEETLPVDSVGIKDGKLCLPPNLNIIASMNTSDQSLFPMDSAFKRRWAWEYVPIDYANAESGKFTISIGGKKYLWHDFLRIINDKIKKVTSSEDKQMGNFFIKKSIDEKEFKDKVMFYIWSEVGKDNYQTNDAIFKCYKPGSTENQEFSFNELYSFGSTQKIQEFMSILGVATIEGSESYDDNEEEITGADGKTKRVKAFYSINGTGRYIPKKLMYEVVSLYVRQNSSLSTKDVLDIWNPIRTIGNVVISEEEYTSKLNSSNDAQFTKRYDSLQLHDGGRIYIFNNTIPKSTQEFISQVNSKNWGIHIERIEEEL